MQTSLLLEMAAGSFPDRLALGARSEGVTYAELAARARAAAHWLIQTGEGPLVFIGLNGVSTAVALYGAGEAGRPFAPLNYRLPDFELQALLARTAPSVAVIDDDMLHRVAEVEGVVKVTRSQFNALCLDPALRERDKPEVEADIAALLFTSGTTGEPKAAVLRHRHLTSYVFSSVEFMGAEDGETALVSVPPYHIAGVAGILSATYSGRRNVYLPVFSPEHWVDLAAAESVTHAMVVPTMLARILPVLEAREEMLPEFRALSYGGGRMPVSIIEKALELLPHVDFANAYGLTETASTISVLGPDDHRMALYSDEPEMRRRLGSVGKPLPTLELEIRGPMGEVLPPGQSGEVYVRGEQVAGEYLHKSVLTEDGWFPTNDAGWLDAEGYLFVEGRLDDVIVRGGENISPGEIEDVLRRQPGVADVAVFGVPDEQWGEAVAAVVVPAGETPAIEALAQVVHDTLRSTKTPEHWEFRTELPYNETGKLLRRVLRAELTAKLGRGG
jgi:fatty-acyl-CoA synthase